MTAQAAIDVVILSWKRAQMTLTAVRSALAQRDVTPIVWVIDQGSDSDNLHWLGDRLASLENVHFIPIGHNLGVAGGRNEGIARGSAEIIVSLDNDAELPDPGSLRYTLDRFRADERLGAMGYSILDASTGDLDRRSWVYPRDQIQYWQQEFMTTRYCGAGHALRRGAFERAGGYDSSLQFYWEEVDLSTRMIDLGYTIIYDPRVRVLHKRAEEARLHWGEDRYYYLVRNALYLEWKFRRSPIRLAAMGTGYLLKGARNGLLTDAVRAIGAAMSMLRKVPSTTPRLRTEARSYIWQHELRFRGNLWKRLRREVLEKLLT